jgi:hypothetical protein
MMKVLFQHKNRLLDIEHWVKVIVFSLNKIACENVIRINITVTIVRLSHLNILTIPDSQMMVIQDAGSSIWMLREQPLSEILNLGLSLKV